MNYVDFNYPDVVGITIIEGKPMTHAKDLLVNEEIVRLKKWTDGAVGKPFDEIKEGTIVGVFLVMCAIKVSIRRNPLC